MTVRELRSHLDCFPDDLLVCVQDGMDPSDPDVATGLERKKRILAGVKGDAVECVEIVSV